MGPPFYVTYGRPLNKKRKKSAKKYLKASPTYTFFPPVLKIRVSASFEQKLSHVEGGGGGELSEAVVERGVPVGDNSINIKLQAIFI